jgi:hypothetical protein
MKPTFADCDLYPVDVMTRFMRNWPTTLRLVDRRHAENISASRPQSMSSIPDVAVHHPPRPSAARETPLPKTWPEQSGPERSLGAQCSYVGVDALLQDHQRQRKHVVDVDMPKVLKTPNVDFDA